MGNNIGNGGFTCSRRSPEDHGGNTAFVDGCAQDTATSGQMLLSGQRINTLGS